MTNQEILKIALQQSAYDCNCNPEDFLSAENKQKGKFNQTNYL